jgi:ribosomal protein L7/L12
MAMLSLCKTCNGNVSEKARMYPRYGQPNPAADSFEDLVRAPLVKTCNDVSTIKFVREKTGWDLKKAKDFVDSLD